MIFFYDRSRRRGAVATLGPDGLSTTADQGEGSFGGWTHVVRQGARLVFHNRLDRSGAVGVMTTDGVITTHVHESGSMASWTHLTACNRGVFFYNRYNGSAAFAKVEDQLTTVQSWEAGSFGNWTHITAAGESSDVLLFTNRFTGAGALGRLVGKQFTTAKVYEPGEFSSWTHVVSAGSTVFFVNRDTGVGAIGTLTPGGLTTTATYAKRRFGGWTHIATDGDRVVFYDRETMSAATGKLSAKGFTPGPGYGGGQLARWSHLAGSSACGPEPDDFLFTVLPVHWPETPSSTLPTRDWLRRYFFDLSNPDGIGRFWLHSSGGNLRLVGDVLGWMKLPGQPMNTGARPTEAQVNTALKVAADTGWKPGRLDGVIVVAASPGASGVAGGSSPGSTLNGQVIPGAVLHGDTRDFVSRGNDPNADTDVRFDFNAHEVGHVIGYQFGFNHAFGPNGVVYFHPYCVMSARTYGNQSVVYDLWSKGSKRMPETQGRGPGLAGSTRAAIGWARSVALTADQFKSGTMLTLARLGDDATVFPEVAWITVPGTGAAAGEYAVEFRSPLTESDQALTPILVVSRRNDPTSRMQPNFGPESSTFVTAFNVTAGSTAGYSFPVSGVGHLHVYEVGPNMTLNGQTGPAWIRLRIGAKKPALSIDPNTPVTPVWPDAISKWARHLKLIEDE